MTWAGTHTPHGDDSQSGTDTMQSDEFEGTGSSLIIAVVNTNNAANIVAGDFSNHDGGGAWTEIASATSNGKTLKLFAAINDATPINERILIASDYRYRIGVLFAEFTEIDTSGTVSACFGTPATTTGNPYDSNMSVMTVGSHANTEGVTLQCYACNAYSASDHITFDNVDADREGRWLMSIIGAYGWETGENTSVDLTACNGNNDYTDHMAIAVELVGVTGGGGGGPPPLNSKLGLLGVGM